MKTIQKLAAFLLALLLACALAMPALAANDTDTGSIEIQKLEDGQKYSVYQLFVLESYNTDPDNDPDTKNDGLYAYTIKSNSPWYGFVSGSGAGKDYVTLTQSKTENNVTTYYVQWNSSKNSEQDKATFAKLALAYAQDTSNSVTATKSAKVSKTQATGGGYTYAITDPTDANQANIDISNDGKLTFSNLNLGYYLVDSSVGTLCALDTTNTTATITDKNEAPTVDKRVQEGNAYNLSNDAAIGETVTFQTTLNAKKGAEKYILHDKMTEGLTFVSVTSVVKKGTDSASDVTLTPKSATVITPYSSSNNDGYTYEVVTTGLEASNACNFHIVFVQDYLDTLNSDDQLVITYTATLNENAIVNGNETRNNFNETWLQYGTEDTTTEHIQTTTKTWSISVFKYTGNNNPLAGATFQVKKAGTDGAYDNSATAVSFVSKTGTDGTNSVRTYRVAMENESSANSEITTTAVTGTTSFKLEGLDSGTYYLEETAAPDGYNKLAGPIKVVISNTGVVKYYPYYVQANNNSHYYIGEGEDEPTGTVKVENKSGSILPSTGGMGTTLFYIIGGILVVVAGVLLVTKKRMDDGE